MLFWIISFVFNDIDNINWIASDRKYKILLRGQSAKKMTKYTELNKIFNKFIFTELPLFVKLCFFYFPNCAYKFLFTYLFLCPLLHHSVNVGNWKSQAIRHFEVCSTMACSSILRKQMGYISVRNKQWILSVPLNSSWTHSVFEHSKRVHFRMSEKI